MKKIFLLLLSIPLLFACDDEVDVKNIPVNITVQRLDKDMLRVDGDVSLIPVMRERYGMFFEYYNAGLIGIGNSRDSLYKDLLHDFLNSPVVKEAYRLTEEVFTNETELNKDLTLGFKYLAHYFPDMLIPRVYTYVSGFNEAIMLTDSIIGIGLDRFLGNFPVYDQLSFPKYQQQNMIPSKIPLACLQSWVASEYFPEGGGEGNLLQQMLYEGKLFYVLNKCFPKTADTLIFGFTEKQMKWCADNEAIMWEFLLENQLLYTNNQFVIQKFVGEAPFTASFPAESPGRACNWLGYRMVEKYMKKKGVSMSELMELEAQTIVKESRYNP
jgi:hypothetical protein